MKKRHEIIIAATINLRKNINQTEHDEIEMQIFKKKSYKQR